MIERPALTERGPFGVPSDVGHRFVFSRHDRRHTVEFSNEPTAV
jgi:hypothetical protein